MHYSPCSASRFRPGLQLLLLDLVQLFFSFGLLHGQQFVSLAFQEFRPLGQLVPVNGLTGGLAQNRGRS